MKIPIATASDLDTVLEKVGRSLSARFGIRVVYQGNNCATNGKTIFLPSLPDDMPTEMLQVIRGYLDHESGHLLGKSNFRIFRWFKNTYGPDAALFLNMLEDLRVEEIMRQRFPGSGNNLHAAHSHLMQEAEKSTEPMPVWRQLAFSVHTRGNRLPDRPFIGQDVRQVLDMILDAVQNAPRCRNTKEVTRLAEKAWPIVSQLFSPPPPSASTRAPDVEQDQADGQAGQDAANNAPDNADDPGQSAGQTSGADDDQDTDQDDGRDGAETEGDTVEEEGEDVGQPSSPGTPQPGSGQGRANTNSQSGNVHIVADETDGATQDNTAAADIMRSLADSIVTMVNDYSKTSRAYRIWTTELDTVHTAPLSSRIPHHQRMAKLLPHVAGVRQKLLQTLLAEPKARWLGDRESGRINPRALHRLASPRAESSGNGRMFRERVRTKRLHTAVTLLVDQSGSMDDRKIHLAGDTALAFCEALSRLGIPSSVVGFTTGDCELYGKDTEAKIGMTFAQLAQFYRIAPLRHIYFKHFHESFRTVSGRFDSMQTLYATPLGESIFFAARELARRPEERKVLLVLTDGRPEVGLGDDAATFEHARSAIKRVEQAGIDVALVGIMENCVEELHHRSVVVNALEDLPKTVMRQLQSLLTSKP